MEKGKKELVVSAIDNGTVIDHIPTHAVYRVIHILGLEGYEDEVLIGYNLDSKKLGKKGIIKIKNKFFEKDEINKIALVAPMASLIVIKNYEVVEKIRTEIPNNIFELLTPLALNILIWALIMCSVSVVKEKKQWWIIGVSAVVVCVFNGMFNSLLFFYKPLHCMSILIAGAVLFLLRIASKKNIINIQ